MFTEIQTLKNNIETNERGKAVENVKRKISSLINNNNSKEAVIFFGEFENEFKGNSSILNILKNNFNNLVDKLFHSEPNFDTIIKLNKLERFFWFKQIENVNFIKGYIAEKMSTFGNDITEIIKLQESRGYYRKANRVVDAARVQCTLSGKVKAFSWAPVNLISVDNPIIEEIRANTMQVLEAWKKGTNEEKMSFLVADLASICPSPYLMEIDCNDDIFSSAALEQCGAIQTVGMSPEDGRVNSGKMPFVPERIDFKDYEINLLIFLQMFIEPVIDWLKSIDGNAHVYQLLDISLKKHLRWDEKSSNYFIKGFIAWMSNYPEVALSFWLPFFESALRNQLVQKGEDVINPMGKTGIEKFILLDGLLSTKAQSHFNSKTIEYWKRLFSTNKNGIGWNLRNAFCHGLLSMEEMKKNIYCLAVLIAYLFLLQERPENR